MEQKPVTYKDSGVDINAGKDTVERITSHVNSTHSSAVLAGMGAFGGLFDLTEVIKGYANPVLVQSIDGVGTKLMVANLANDHSKVGIDIVNHGCNDVLCQGAKPVTFLDYVAMSKLNIDQMESIVAGMAIACKAAGVALMGGETAELPGMYRDKEYDLAGVMTGVVERSKVVDGKSVKAGMVVIGLASNGLHTNGYTLARKVLFEIAGYSVDSTPDGWGETVGEALLAPHINYTEAVLGYLKQNKVHGMAHITGGGMQGNLLRALPDGVKAVVEKSSFPQLPVFAEIAKKGNVPEDDMYLTFNMGVGYTLIIDSHDAAGAVEFFNKAGHEAAIIGKIVSGNKIVELI